MITDRAEPLLGMAHWVCRIQSFAARTVGSSTAEWPARQRSVETEMAALRFLLLDAETSTPPT
jgi:hypothetical protein